MDQPTAIAEENRLPKSAHRHFWEIDPAELDVSEYPRYVIERLLEYGDVAEVRWMFERFSRDEVVETLKSSSNLSRFSAEAWANFLGVNLEQVRCTSRRFLRERRPHWPF